jgi:peroxiredoxin
MRKRSKTRLLWALTAACIAAGTALVWSASQARPLAPTATFSYLDGGSVGSAQLQGKVVLVNFWSTSCTTCVHEMPQVAAMQRRFQAQGYETVPVAMSYDDAATVRRFAQTRQLPFRVALDRSGELAHRFGDVQLTPTSVLIDKHGREVERFTGEPDFDRLSRRIARLLAES